ncbi:MAG: DUF1566 domain-containing protein, partial [Candidatus Omnitrophota bacterium]
SQETSGTWLESAGPDSFTRGTISLYIANSAGSMAITALRVDNQGNVGIGTIAPLAKLDIGVGTTGPVLMVSSNNGNATHGDYLTVTSTGNVGIGTTDPGVKFQVAGAVRVDEGSGNGVQFSRSYPTAHGHIYVDDVANTILTYMGYYGHRWLTSSGEIVRITQSGNVGVGTVVPVARFHVGVGAPSGTADLSTNSALIKGNLEVDGKIYGDGSMLTGVSGAVSGLTTYAVPRASSSTTLVDSGIYLDVNGNVGVGATNPDVKLEVNGLGRFTGTGGLSVGGDYGQNRIQMSTSGFTRILVLGTTNGYIPISAQALSIGGTYGDTASPSSGAIIQGNVGIGTTAPRGKLEVDGSIYVPNGFGNIGLGTTEAGTLLTVGPTPPTLTAGSSPVAAFKGDLVVDGVLYGDGSQLTNIPSSGGISDLTTYAVPRASSATTIVDSGIYTDANGNVGIGTTNPLTKLNVRGTGDYINGIVLEGYLRPSVIFNNGSFLWAAGMNDGSSNYTIRGVVSPGTNNGYDWFVIDTAGNVGIGTTAPASRLNVETNSDAFAGVVVENLADSANAASGIVFSAGNGATVGFAGAYPPNYSFYPLFADSQVVWANASASGGLVLGNSGGLVRFMRSSTVEAMRMTGGNLGIGTSGPRAKLEIVASGSTTGTAFQIDDSLYSPKVTVLDNGNVGIGTTVPWATLQVGVNPSIPSGSSPAAAIKGNLVVDGKIYGDGSNITGLPGGISGLTTYALPRASSATTIVDSGIYLDANGNVGIGSVSPGVALDVVGSIRASTVQVVNITSTPYTIASSQNGVNFTYTNAAAGTVNLPAISGLNDGFTVTIARQVAKSLTITANGTDGFPGTPSGTQGTLEMQGNNIATITLMKAGSYWNIVNKTDDCIVGQSCWATGMIYAGTLNGHQYFTTQGCTSSSSCSGTDSVTKTFASSGCSSSYCGANAQYVLTTSATNQATLATTTGDSAFKFCADLNSNSIAGQTDWYLPTTMELNLLYQNQASIGGFYTNPLVAVLLYWSSTESGNSYAWLVNNSQAAKTDPYHVRCVRTGETGTHKVF